MENYTLAWGLAAFAAGAGSMSRDLRLSNFEVALGLAVFAWGFGVAPLALAPLSEDCMLQNCWFF